MSAEPNSDAIAVFESMRAKVEATNAEEPTIDEINAFIAAVRRERKGRSERGSRIHD